MGNNAVKTIVLLMVLVVLSFVIGAQVSDNVNDSMGAFAIIGAVVGGGLLIYMGPKVWQLLFILPPFVEAMPVPRVGHAIMQCGEAPFYVSAVVLIYWVVLWSLGRVRIRWRGAFLLDFIYWVFVGFMVAAFIRHPVVIQALNLDYDDIGGEEFIILFLVMTYYIAVSIIPITKPELEKCLALSFKLFFIASFLFVLKGIFFKHQLADEEMGEHNVRRIYMFYPLGSALVFWAYSKYPVGKMLSSLRCWAALMYGAFATLITGQRQNMALLACGVAFIACIKREVVVLIMALLAAYAGLLLLGEMRMMEDIPASFQRVLTSVPGVKADEKVQWGAEGTMKTRYLVWDYALDPTTGAIKDQMWGDGFAISRAYIMRKGIARLRGNGGGTDDNESMTYTRNFHNGAIHTISRIGYVGLAWCAVMCIIAWAVSIQVLRAWFRTETYPYIVLGIINMPIILLTYGYSNYVTKHFMYSLQSLFFLKLCYCIARENGLLRPLFAPARYVPLMIQEAEKQSQAA